jgi:hypothetical protein
MLAVFAEYAEPAVMRSRELDPGAEHRTVPQGLECHVGLALGLSKREIAKRLKVGRTSVRRVLTQRLKGTLALSLTSFSLRKILLVRGCAAGFFRATLQPRRAAGRRAEGDRADPASC